MDFGASLGKKILVFVVVSRHVQFWCVSLSLLSIEIARKEHKYEHVKTGDPLEVPVFDAKGWWSNSSFPPSKPRERKHFHAWWTFLLSLSLSSGRGNRRRGQGRGTSLSFETEQRGAGSRRCGREGT